MGPAEEGPKKQRPRLMMRNFVSCCALLYLPVELRQLLGELR